MSKGSKDKKNKTEFKIIFRIHNNSLADSRTDIGTRNEGKITDSKAEFLYHLAQIYIREQRRKNIHINEEQQKPSYAQVSRINTSQSDTSRQNTQIPNSRTNALQSNALQPNAPQTNTPKNNTPQTTSPRSDTP